METIECALDVKSGSTCGVASFVVLIDIDEFNAIVVYKFLCMHFVVECFFHADVYKRESSRYCID